MKVEDMGKMELTTNSATTKDWLRATEHVQISAYDPGGPMRLGTQAEGVFTKDDFEKALRKVSRRSATAKSGKGRS